MITSGEGRLQVHLDIQKIGPDFLFILGGGEQPHIGGVIVCTPNEDPKVIRLGSHYDYLVLEPLAVKACRKYKTTVVAVGGIHIDHARKDEIDMIIKNCEKLQDMI
jgi:gallate decarboxylase subunit D